jgi:ABC-type multidrug transport system permease subunit
MLGALSAALRKDLVLLARDRVGLVFLTIAPVVVITVAGLSLANLYGSDPRGASRTTLVVVDEDGGELGRTLLQQLAEDATVDVASAATREAARALIRGKSASAALVVAKGTTAALEGGEQATLYFYTDPVRSLDVAHLRAVVQEIRHGVESEARAQAQAELDTARARAHEARGELARTTERLRTDLEALTDRLASAQRRAHDAQASALRALPEAAAKARASQVAAARGRLARVLEPVRAFLVELRARRAAFFEWMTEARKQAGRFADRIPPPPEMPDVPPAVAELVDADPEALASRILPPDARGVELPKLPAPELLPALVAPRMPALPDEVEIARLPGPLVIEETSVTGAPRNLNTFDQNVPGFGVTFLLLGVLLGVSLGLLDERDWGTLMRVRAMPAPFSVFLIAKLGARFLVGMVQMALLFAVGHLVFGASLGSEPWALALPTAGIVFAGTAFGLVVAGLAPSREAVLPAGSIAILTMAAAGGCWWPIDLEPQWMRTVALAFPTTWAMEAYNDLMIRRWPASAVVESTLVLFAHGTAYLLLGLALFRQRVARGA